MTGLSWRPAAKEDRLLLQGFTCTVPALKPFGGNKPVHSRPWELEIQKAVRTDALAKANKDADEGFDGRFQLGRDGDELVACFSHSLLKSPGIETPLRAFLEFDGPIRVLKLLAVSSAVRGKGGGVADAALVAAADDMFDRDGSELVILGRIDYRNGPSQRLVERLGFRQIQDLTDGEYQTWYTIYAGGD